MMMKTGILKKMSILGFLILIAALFFYFDLGRFLSLEYLKSSQLRFQELYQQHKLLIIGGYMLVYITVAALSLPGAAVFSAYVQVQIKDPSPGEIEIPEIHHTNRAFIDNNNSDMKKNVISTFAVTLPGDLDKDLDVDLGDLAVLARNWLKGTD